MWKNWRGDPWVLVFFYIFKSFAYYIKKDKNIVVLFFSVRLNWKINKYRVCLLTILYYSRYNPIDYYTIEYEIEFYRVGSNIAERNDWVVFLIYNLSINNFISDIFEGNIYIICIKIGIDYISIEMVQYAGSINNIISLLYIYIY